uniref:Uncharacterized protein n=1 Tax=uncultured marine microorganism HF4000_48F7 TaxID=455500 RepID=B3SZV8_9ZZZZ|nr:hypothetical protein ALOHA_HF400048F7ctg1g33 [uncultured marine microorganism HF4000_48F7]
MLCTSKSNRYSTRVMSLSMCRVVGRRLFNVCTPLSCGQTPPPKKNDVSFPSVWPTSNRWALSRRRRAGEVSRTLDSAPSAQSREPLLGQLTVVSPHALLGHASSAVCGWPWLDGSHPCVGREAVP